MASEQAENGTAQGLSAAESFRAHLRAKLQDMRENARRLGASSRYIEAIDRSAGVVLAAVTAQGPMNETEANPAD